MFFYCSHCGLIANKKREEECPVCNVVLKSVPEKYLSSSKNLFLSQEMRDAFVEEVIKCNPSYDHELAAQRDNILNMKATERKKEIDQKVQEYKDTKTVCRCPVCGSTNLSAISNLGKVVKISLLGVWGAGDLGKKRYCNSCGHKF